MKIYISILIFLFASFNVFAQSDLLKVDSLKKALQTEKEDSNKVKTLSEIARLFSYSSAYDSSSYYANQGLSYAQKIHYLKGEADDSYILARNYVIQGNMPKAFPYLKKALEIFEQLGNDELLIEGLNLYAILVSDPKNLRKQLDVFFEAEKIAIRLHDSDKLQMLFGNIAGVYKGLEKRDSAEIYYKKAYELSTKINNDYGRVGWLSNLGLLYLNEEKDKEALAILYQCLSFSYLDNKSFWIGSVYYGIGKLHLKNHNLDSAFYYAHKSFETANSNPDSLSAVMDPAQLLSELYERQNNYEEALHYFKLATSAKDSVYNSVKAQQLSSLVLQEKEKEQELITAKKDFHTKLIIYIILSALLIVALFTGFLYKNNKQQKKANAAVEKAYNELKSTQAQLIQSEKMASLGELTAGIAHEIQNPLNFVNNFSEVNTELIDEMQQALQAGNTEEAFSISSDLKDNEQKIIHHGKRADSIVKGMLEHSRVSTGQKEPTDINALADEYLRLSYHGMRAKDKSFNATLQTDFDNSIGKINVVPQDIGRVLLNLFNNAFYALMQKKKEFENGYEPAIGVTTKKVDGKVEIHVRDNGIGIPQKVIDKIFQPFFTTKPTGQGTGLGLSLSYDIVKTHGGEIKVETKEDDGAQFIIELPIQ